MRIAVGALTATAPTGAGHGVVGMSRSLDVDLSTGEGLDVTQAGERAETPRRSGPGAVDDRSGRQVPRFRRAGGEQDRADSVL